MKCYNFRRIFGGGGFQVKFITKVVLTLNIRKIQK